jgi:hypothetical protein
LFQKSWEEVAVVPVDPVYTRFVTPAFVAKRLVVVTAIPVATVKSTLRSEDEPTTTNVPVTLEEAATNPPKNWAVVVVKEPRAVTLWSVSLSTVPAGQPTPLCKQTADPMTVAVAKVPIFAVSWTPVAVLKVKVVMVPLVAKKFVVVTETEDKLVIVPFELVRLTMVPLVARKFVPVAEVKESEVIVPFVELRFVIVPLAEAKVLIVPEFAIKESPVAFVKPKLVAKRFVEVVLVPVALTQVRPVTPKVSTARLVKEALVANKLVEVTEVLVTFPRTAFQRLVFVPRL